MDDCGEGVVKQIDYQIACENNDDWELCFQVFVFIKLAEIMSNWAKSTFSLK